MRTRIAAVAAFALFFSLLAFGQVPVRSSGRAMPAGGFSGSVSYGGPVPFGMAVVTGAPYSGEEVNEHVQTLADGTHITQKIPVRMVYRDSQGRTRSERPFVMFPGATDSPRMIELTDPAAGYQYVLDAQNKIAHRMALPPPPNGAEMSGALASRTLAVGQAQLMAPRPIAMPVAPPLPGTPAAVGLMGGVMRSGSFSSTLTAPAGPSPDGRPVPEFKTESLGTQMIDGVLCDGTRRTTTFPTGFQGNDAPIVTTQESWFSPELKIMMRSKSSDPRTGEETYQILNFSRAEPDPMLFQVPPDYQTVDETGSFTINFSK